MSLDRCVLIFLKSPDQGTVKSRLSAGIGDEAALALYRAFGLDVLETLDKGGYPLKIFFYPPDAREKISQWIGKGRSCSPQRGNDLGERMKNAFIRTFSEGFREAVLIGSDIPDLTNDLLRDAFEFEGRDAVIGPAHDGGYYLIGFKSDTFLPGIFEDMPWSSDEVFKSTMEIFRKNRYSVHVLPKWRDVDTLEDLRSLAARNRDTAFARSRTMTLISKHLGRLLGENEYP